MIYDGRDYTRLATLPGMFERCLTVSSAGAHWREEQRGTRSCGTVHVTPAPFRSRGTSCIARRCSINQSIYLSISRAVGPWFPCRMLYRWRCPRLCSPPVPTLCRLRNSRTGKTFSCTGWKIGWVVGPAHLVKGACSHYDPLAFFWSWDSSPSPMAPSPCLQASSRPTSGCSSPSRRPRKRRWRGRWSR
jgi:hypothetical protein